MGKVRSTAELIVRHEEGQKSISAEVEANP